MGIETPADDTLRRYRRALIREDRQREFISLCRSLGIRTVAGFLIGFPDDTEESVARVRDYAEQINPTYANFNVVTPYPGTPFFEQMRGQIADADFSHYTVYTPLLKYEHLTAARVEELLAKCFHRFYFRGRYLRKNAALLWPVLRKLGLGRRPRGPVSSDPATPRRSSAAFRRGTALARDCARTGHTNAPNNRNDRPGWTFAFARGGFLT